MCHSVGVSRTSSSPPVGRCTRLAREVDREVGRRDDRLLLGGRGAPQRGAQPGEQLVHAERLGHVVVGAGVERGDLVGLAVAHGQHDDRHRAPAAQAADHVDAVDAGQAEVEDDDVGVVARGERRAPARPSGARSTS